MLDTVGLIGDVRCLMATYLAYILRLFHSGMTKKPSMKVLEIEPQPMYQMKLTSVQTWKDFGSEKPFYVTFQPLFMTMHHHISIFTDNTNFASAVS